MEEARWHSYSPQFRIMCLPNRNLRRFSNFSISVSFGRSACPLVLSYSTHYFPLVYMCFMCVSLFCSCRSLHLLFAHSETECLFLEGEYATLRLSYCALFALIRLPTSCSSPTVSCCPARQAHAIRTVSCCPARQAHAIRNCRSLFPFVFSF